MKTILSLGLGIALFASLFLFNLTINTPTESYSDLSFLSLEQTAVAAQGEGWAPDGFFDGWQDFGSGSLGDFIDTYLDGPGVNVTTMGWQCAGTNSEGNCILYVEVPLSTGFICMFAGMPC